MDEAIVCEWCGEPVLEGSKLCEKCTAIHRQIGSNEVGPLSNNLPERQKVTGGSILAAIGKGLLAALMSIVALIAALAGTCALIGTGVVGISILPFALGAVAITIMMVWLIYRMYRTDIKSAKTKHKRIETRKSDETETETGEEFL